ncbi:pentatricopeptide repeat-containing protein At2g13420, mitochondrial isoform X1 [Elaeis guineensis]|uniref:Pentatricopeptide repeat-containing protein At2g13420, mitochondrial isoform X2 n=1 Tax=Elaeis guineensis var. tenera TaxID=51953 RepID=A0A8N4ICA5_ELAGV|nr:pentatricopeptide repeat-containing protein At2g13420, mitochondrial isoform X2 [Elaeis guineensis]
MSRAALTSAGRRHLLPPPKPRLLSHSPLPELGLGFSGSSPKPSPPPLRPSDDADALARLLIHHHNPFHPLESPLQLVGIQLSGDLVLQTLLRLRHASKVALSFFVWARDHAHHVHGADAYDLMIDTLGKVRQFDVAWQLIIEMDQSGGAGPTPRTFAILVRRYIAAGMTRQAVRAFDDMEAFIGREPGVDDFKMLLDTLCKYGYPKVATEIFNKRKFKYEPDEKTYTILIYGWCKVNRHEMAQKFLKEMVDRGLEPNVVTYNVLLNGICRKASLHPDNRFDRTIHAAEGLLEEMQRKGIEPDVTSYSIILHVYSRAHKPELSLCMLRSMKEKGICPTVAPYTSVIKCLASCGRLEDAEDLLNEMASNGVCPCPATYNCFFKEYHGRKDVDGAVKLYKKMKGMGSLSTPDIHTFNILIEMFSKLNQMELVKELWNDMVESSVGPDLDSYTLLIHGLCEKQKWREACQFFMEMIEKGFLPHKVTFETLYSGLIQSDMLRTWRRLKNKVEEESLKFGSEFQHYHFKPYKRIYLKNQLMIKCY